MIVDYVGYDSPAEQAGLTFDQVITLVEIPQVQPIKQLIYIPTFALLALVVFIQRRRKRLLINS